MLWLPSNGVQKLYNSILLFIQKVSIPFGVKGLRENPWRYQEISFSVVPRKTQRLDAWKPTATNMKRCRGAEDGEAARSGLRMGPSGDRRRGGWDQDRNIALFFLLSISEDP